MSEDFHRLFKRSYHDFGEVLCDSCGETVEFSDCDDLFEAGEKWNDHLEDCVEIKLARGEGTGEWVSYTEARDTESEWSDWRVK